MKSEPFSGYRHILLHGLHPLLVNGIVVLQAMAGVGAFEILIIHAVFFQYCFKPKSCLKGLDTVMGAVSDHGRHGIRRDPIDKGRYSAASIHGLFQEWIAEGSQGENRPLGEFLRSLFAHFEKRRSF